MAIPLPIGFLGAGNMAEALIGGILGRGLARPEQVFISDIRPERLEELATRLGVRPAPSNRDLVRDCRTVVFAVKPQNVRDVCREIAPSASRDVLFISICAGVSTAFFESLLGGAARVLRVMPNTPALIGCGASALAPGRHADDHDLTAGRLLFEAVGITIVVEESLLDAVTGLTGSGPAYVFYLIEALIEAGIEQGLDPRDSANMVMQMVWGAARLARESTRPPAELRKAVTSPGGTTAAGLDVLCEGDFAGLLKRCVARATERGRELGSQYASPES
jgi:pyrroline-5-carboxylate reductase